MEARLALRRTRAQEEIEMGEVVMVLYDEAIVLNLRKLLDERDAEIERLQSEVNDWMNMAVAELKGKGFGCTPDMARRYNKALS